jgi:fluoride ion exporter CrcB/FEX
VLATLPSWHMQPAWRLRDVTLTGGRRLFRAFLHVWIAASAACDGLFLALDRHRVDADFFNDREGVDWGPWHAFAIETFGLPIFACAVTLASAWWSRRRFPRGLLTGFLASATAFGTFSLWIAAHLFDDVDTNGAMDVGLLALVPLFFSGLALLIAEPVMVRGERRRLEAEADPVIPTARLVA